MIPPVKKQRVKHDYIDKKKFYEEMVKYRLNYIDREEKGLDKPKIPNYIGECLLLICERLSYRYNFINYSFREEMVGDALENCFAAIDNYDINQEKKNPFGYFGFIAWRAFVRRIKKEEKETYTKHKYFHESGLHSQLISDSDDIIQSGNNEVSNKIIEKFESKVKAKKVASAVKTNQGVEKFFDG